MAWDPAQYERFKEERRRPFTDLLDLVRPRPAMRVVDLGCGTGDTTRLLHDRLAARETLGLDGSAEMLARSREFAAPALRFEQRAIEDFAEDPRGPWDLVFSNAALHWVPDHARLFPRLAAALSEDGQLAVGMPLTYDDELHTAARVLAQRSPFAERLAGYAGYPRPLAPAEYERVLLAAGLREAHARVNTYEHELPSRDGAVDWYRGTYLTAFEARLGALYARFLDDLRAELARRLPDERPFRLRVPRLLLWATR